MQVWRKGGKLQDSPSPWARCPTTASPRAERGRADPKPAVAANRLGLVVSELSEEKRKEG